MVSRRKTKNTTRKHRRMIGGDENVELLMRGVKSKNLGWVRDALDRGADINAVDKHYQQSALFFASADGYLEIVKELLDRGASMNAKPNTFSFPTPLFRASWNGHTAVVKLLIERGVDVNAKTSNGETALHFAIEEYHSDIVEILIKNGADVNAVMEKGEAKKIYTPIRMAAVGSPIDPGKVERQAKIVRLLMEKGADHKKTYENGKSAYDVASPKIREVMDLIQRKRDRTMAVKVGVQAYEGKLPLYLPSHIAKYLGGRRTRKQKQKTNRNRK